MSAIQIPYLKLFRNKGGVANLKLSRYIYGIEYLKLFRKEDGINHRFK